LKRSSHRTLVEVRLETGRKHQIRVHLAERGHPIVGDRAYGSRSNPIRRMALHATKLDFTHPFTGQLMQFYSPPPPFFSALL
jgi:23S rRNA pseudouridine1911/1915/1917 synthase